MVLDELWPLVLKHSYALARLAAAHGYWAAHGDAFAAPRSLRGVHKHVRAWASYCDSRCSRAAYGTFAVLRGIGALRARGTGYCWVPYDPVRQARSSVRATMRRTSFISSWAAQADDVGGALAPAMSGTWPYQSRYRRPALAHGDQGAHAVDDQDVRGADASKINKGLHGDQARSCG